MHLPWVVWLRRYDNLRMAGSSLLLIFIHGQFMTTFGQPPKGHCGNRPVLSDRVYGQLHYVANFWVSP